MSRLSSSSVQSIALMSFNGCKCVRTELKRVTKRYDNPDKLDVAYIPYGLILGTTRLFEQISMYHQLWRVLMIQQIILAEWGMSVVKALHFSSTIMTEMWQ